MLRLLRRLPVLPPNSSPQPGLAAALSRGSYSSRYYSGRDTKTGLGILALIGGGCAAVTFYRGKQESVPITRRSHWLRFSPAAESKIGLAQLDRITSPIIPDDYAPKESYVLPANHPDTVRVRLITENITTALRRSLVGGPMTKHLEGRGAEWEVILLKNDLVEAFGIPGRKIVVFTGMLDCLSSDDEIAYVISHEIGHVVARHSAERMTSRWIWTIVHLFLRTFSLCPNLSDTMSSFHNFEPFPLEMEMEADHIGLSILASAGYDLHAAPKAYSKISRCPYDCFTHYYFSRHLPYKNKRALLLCEGCDTIQDCDMSRVLLLCEDCDTIQDCDTSQGCDKYQGSNTDMSTPAPCTKVECTNGTQLHLTVRLGSWRP